MYTLGIHVDKPFLRIALLKKGRGKVEVRSLKTHLLTEVDHVKQFYIPSYKRRVVSALPSRDLLVRELQLRVGNQRHLEEIATFQVDATSHLQSSEVLLVPYFLKKGKEKCEGFLLSASRSAMRSLIEELGLLDLDPDVISAVPVAQVQYARWKYPSMESAFLIDLGSSEWSCTLLEKGQLKKSHSIDGGVETLLSALAEDRKKNLLFTQVEGVAKLLDLLQIKPHLNPQFSSKLHQMRQEFARTLYSYHQLVGPLPVLFTGRYDACVHLREYLLEAAGEWISADSPRFTSSEEQKYAVASGLAVGSSKSGIQFRREEFFPRKNWKRLGAIGMGLLFTSLALSIFLISLGRSSVASRQKEMVNALHTALDRTDHGLSKTVFAQKEDSEKILTHWSQAIHAHSKEYPYIHQAPKVAQLFSWLENHPFILEMKQEKDPLELIHFRYRLEKFPHIDALQDPYIAKAEIEFRVQNPLNARKFHEALLQEEAWIDLNQELRWEVLKNTYRVSFYLKNRTCDVP